MKSFAIAIGYARHRICRMEGLKSSEQEAQEIVDAIPQSLYYLISPAALGNLAGTGGMSSTALILALAVSQIKLIK